MSTVLRHRRSSLTDGKTLLVNSSLVAFADSPAVEAGVDRGLTVRANDDPPHCAFSIDELWPATTSSSAREVYAW